MGFSIVFLCVLFISKILDTNTDKPHREEYNYVCCKSTPHKFRWNISPNRNQSHNSYDNDTQNSKSCEEIFERFRIHFVWNIKIKLG